MKTMIHQSPCSRSGHRMPSSSRAVIFAVLFAALLMPDASVASETSATDSRWTLLTRVVAVGSSDEAESDPQGYKVYSAFTIEAGLRRRLGSRFSLELDLRTESREVELFPETPETVRLGSLELVPLNLFLQYRPCRGAVRPYIGAGANLTVCWEKSGGLDSTGVSSSLAPAIQLGLDIGRGARTLFNVDLRWNPMRTDLTAQGARIARLQLDGPTLGLGVGFQF